MSNEIPDRVKDLQHKELIKKNDEMVYAIRRTVGNHAWYDTLTAEQLEHVRHAVRTFVVWSGLKDE